MRVCLPLVGVIAALLVEWLACLRHVMPDLTCRSTQGHPVLFLFFAYDCSLCTRMAPLFTKCPLLHIWHNDGRWRRQMLKLVIVVVGECQCPGLALDTFVIPHHCTSGRMPLSKLWLQRCGLYTNYWMHLLMWIWPRLCTTTLARSHLVRVMCTKSQAGCDTRLFTSSS